MAKATFGTGTSVLLNVGDTFQACRAKARWRPSPGSIDGRPTYALEGLINYSSATIAWLKDQLGLIRDAAETDALARSVDDNGGVYLVPAFSGLSAPYWSPDARAAIVGMTAHSRKEHIVRAALESIAYQIRDVLDMMRGGRRRCAASAARRRWPDAQRIPDAVHRRHHRHRAGRVRGPRVVRTRRRDGRSAWARRVKSLDELAALARATRDLSVRR